jgi:hypothetical protein
MGQILLWIELLAASCLMVAVAVVDASRLKEAAYRLLIVAVGVLIPMGCWATVTFISLWLRITKRVGPASSPLTLLLLSLAFLVITLVILRRGLRNQQARRWSAWKLNLIFASVCILSLLTFWNLDLNAKNQLGHLRARAASIMASTFQPRIPDSQNAARIYEQAFESLEMTNKKKIITWAVPVCKWLNSPQGTASPERLDDEQIRKILKTYSRGLNQLRRAAGMSHSNFVGSAEWTELPSALYTKISSIHTSAELLAASARMQAIDGNIPQAFADINGLFSMAEHITREPTVNTALVAVAVEIRAAKTLETVLARGDASAKDLSLLNIEPLFSHGRTVRSALRGEEVMGLSVLASLGDPGQHPLPDEHFPEILLPLYRVFLLEEEIRSGNKAVQEWRRLANMPYHLSREQWLTFPERLLKHQTGFLIMEKLHSTSRYPGRAAEGDAYHSLSRLAAAVTIFRLKTGDLPKDLDDLAPEFIETIPTDPFDGKPLRMILTAGGGAILYSVGADLKDNGGAAMNIDDIGDIAIRMAASK